MYINLSKEEKAAIVEGLEWAKQSRINQQSKHDLYEIDEKIEQINTLIEKLKGDSKE